MTIRFSARNIPWCVAVAVCVLGVFVLASSVFARQPMQTKAGQLTDVVPAITESAHHHQGQSTQTPIHPRTLSPAFPFNGLLVTWPSDSSMFQAGGPTLEVRVREGSSWSEWIRVSPLDDTPSAEKMLNGRRASEPLFFQNAEQFQYQLRGSEGDTSHVIGETLEFIYIDSRTPKKPLSWLRRVLAPRSASANSLTTIVSRSEWGADESFRMTGEGGERWERTYAPVQKFIIHHTAGSSGNGDPAAVVRGIYYFHAVILGWGDIGYNYLLDPQGVIYEGRYGGDGVVGGHAYNDQDRTDYNQGTVGIAFLGNYESDVLSDLARGSVARLIAEKSRLFSIDPSGSSTFQKRQDLPNISGHRDVDATLCPGQNIENQLSTIRQMASTELAALPPVAPAEFRAQRVSASPQTIIAEAGKTTMVISQFTNTSTVQWQSYIPSRRVSLRPVNTNSLLASSAWIDAYTASVGDDANVPIGATATFSLPVIPSQTLVAADEEFALFDPNGQEIPETRARVAVTVSNQAYAAVIEGVSIPRATFLGQMRTAIIRIQNVGTQVWNAGDISLHLADINGKESAYRLQSWKSPFGDFAIGHAVQPGESTTISLKMKTPAKPGMYANIFSVARSDGKPIASQPRHTVTRADSPWKAELVKKSFPIALKKNWKRTLTVTYKNTGITTWTRRTIALRLYDTARKPSRFTHLSWRVNGSVFRFQETKVKPGGTATFVIKLQAPPETGVYKNILALEGPKKSTMIENGVTEFFTRVD
jgi:hypothetical protein